MAIPFIKAADHNPPREPGKRAVRGGGGHTRVLGLNQLSRVGVSRVTTNKATYAPVAADPYSWKNAARMPIIAAYRTRARRAIGRAAGVVARKNAMNGMPPAKSS